MSSNTEKTEKTPKAKKPAKAKTERHASRFTKDGKTLGIGVNGNRLSSFTLDAADVRTKGKVIVLDPANGTPKEQFDAACARAVKAGWEPAKKEYSLDDLLGE